MGKNIKIICSVIPSGKTADHKCRFSVFLSPRLPDNGKLSDYFEMMFWTDFKDFFVKNPELKIRLGKIDPDTPGNYKTNAFTEQFSINPDRSRLDSIASENPKIHDGPYIWKHLFSGDTPVEQWLLDEGLYRDRYVHLNKATKTEKPATTLSEPAVPYPKEDVIDHTITAAHNDISDNLLYAEEIKYKNRLNQEFHKKMSILAGYPDLLRSTGWIHDYTADLPTGLDFNIVKLDIPDVLSGTLADEKFELFTDAVDFKTPWTYVNGTTFNYAYADKYKANYFDVQDGYINAVGPGYHVEAVQYLRSEELKKVAERTKNFSNNSDQLTANDFTGLTGLLDSQSKPEQDTSEGIELKLLSSGATPAETVISHQPGTDQVIELPDADIITIDGENDLVKNIDQYILFGHQIDSGYIVEVSKANDDRYHSLCERMADYAVETARDFEKVSYDYILKNFRDHPAISEVAIAGKSGKIYVQEDICRWNNWSLVCQQRGTHPGDPTSDPQYFEYNKLELLNIRPLPGSLLPMRFGQAYKFLLKIVDICGNYTSSAPNDSLAVKMTDDYKRLENIEAIAPYFGMDLFQHHLFRKKTVPEVAPEYYGEQLELVVIRTSVRGDKTGVTNPVSSRTFTPARVNFAFAELHGEFDRHWHNEKARQTIFRSAAYHGEDGKPEIFEGNALIPFLTDPAVSGIHFEFDVVHPAGPDNPPRKESFHTNVLFPSTGDYLDKRFISLTLQADTTSGFIPASAGSVVFGMVQTGIVSLKLKAIPNPRMVGFFKTPPAPKELYLTLVHATDRPVLLPQATPGSSFKVADRLPFSADPGNINISFNTNTYNQTEHFPFSSAADVQLEMKYKKLIIDKSVPRGYQLQETLQLLKVKNTGTEQSNFLPELNYSGTLMSEFFGLNNDMTHSFNDTRHYEVDYTLVGYSRFMNFFPASPAEGFSYRQEIGKNIIKNSEKLKAPSVSAIVPLLDWEDHQPNTFVRKNTAFRIYLDGDWFASGEGEKMAVLYLNGENTVPDELQNLISSYGKDPSTTSKPTSGLNDHYFEGCKFVKDINYKLFNVAPRAWSDDQVYDGSAYSGRLHAALFEVKCDPEQRRFYADIRLSISTQELSDQQNYMPFFKFAVARYQENSISQADHYDYRFSSVNMTPQVQQIPYRELTLTQGRAKIAGPERHTLPIYSRDNSQILSKAENEFYLVVTDRTKSDSDPKLSKNEKVTRLESADLNYISMSLNNIPKNADVYLEEFEIYDFLDAEGNSMFGLINTLEPSYNPRDDIRKRLISSFKISSL